jgi:hypothetical protein
MLIGDLSVGRVEPADGQEGFGASCISLLEVRFNNTFW